MARHAGPPHENVPVAPFLNYSRALNRRLFRDQFYGGVGLSVNSRARPHPAGLKIAAASPRYPVWHDRRVARPEHPSNRPSDVLEGLTPELQAWAMASEQAVACPASPSMVSSKRIATLGFPTVFKSTMLSASKSCFTC